MSPETIKLIAPIIIFIAWSAFALRQRNVFVAFSGLFFVSYAGFSSNYVFVYREIHQLIQILLICLFVFPLLMTGITLRINSILIIFFIFITMSLIFSPFDEDSKSQLINFLALFGVVNFLFKALRSAKDLDSVLRFSGSISILLAVIGIVEFSFNPQGRIEATFSNPNYYGLVLGVGLCIVTASWRGWKRNFALTLILLAIILTGSRSALAFPILQFLWMIYRAGKIRKIVPLVLGFLLVTLLVLSSGYTRVTDKGQTEASDAERIVFAKIALRMAYSHPLTGVGWGRFVSEFTNYSSFVEQIITESGVTDAAQQDRRVTHNDYLRILAELGWVAFIASILLSIYGLRILIIESGFCLDYLPPIWLGILVFSLSHNNMNSAFFWFFFLLPFFLKSLFSNKDLVAIRLK